MGYSTRNNGLIKDYWPDDTDTEFYLTGSHTIVEIVHIAREKWRGNINYEDIVIESENIHTSCLTYDCHDSSDYTQFIVIRRKE